MNHDLSSDWAQLAAFAAAVDASMGKWLMDQYGIGLTEFRAITHLSQAQDKELRVNDLAQKVGLNQSSATRLVSRLEAKELTLRDVCPDDGRGIYAVITERAEKLLKDAGSAYEERIQETLKDAAARYPQFDARRLSKTLSSISALLST